MFENIMNVCITSKIQIAIARETAKTDAITIEFLSDHLICFIAGSLYIMFREHMPIVRAEYKHPKVVQTKN